MGLKLVCTQHNVDLVPDEYQEHNGHGCTDTMAHKTEGSWWIDLSHWNCPKYGMYIDKDGTEYGCDNTWEQIPVFVVTGVNVQLVLETLEDAIATGLTPETVVAIEQITHILNSIQNV